MTLKIDAKFEEKLTFYFKNNKNLVKFDKTCTLICSYCAKYLMFDLKSTEELSFMTLKGDFWFGKWHEEYSEFSPEHLKVSKLGFWWDPLIQSRKSMSTENYIVISKLTRRIWWILAPAFESLKNFHFNVLLLSKVYID